MADPTIPPEDNPFATMTPAQALANLNRAIFVVENQGQSYQIGDRKLQRGDLRWMYPERARLEKEAAKAARGGIRFKRVVPI